MDVNLIPSTGISFFKKNISNFFSSQRIKEILIVASWAFASLAICYFIIRFCLYKANILNGQATKIDPKDGKVEQGNFTNGKLSGKGKIIYPNGRIEEGNFVNGELWGDGKITYPEDGRIEEGWYSNRKIKLDSYRKIIYPNGKVWEGKFDDKFNGEGKFIDLDNIQTGSFKKGLLHGEGKITYSEGIEIIGAFHLGKPIWGEKSENGFLLGFFKHGEFCEEKLTAEEKAKYAIVPPKMSYVNAFRAIWEKAKIPPAIGLSSKQISELEEEQVSTSEKAANFIKKSVYNYKIDYVAARRIKVYFTHFPRLFVDHHNQIYGVGAAQKALDEYDKIPTELRFDKFDSYKFSDLKKG